MPKKSKLDQLLAIPYVHARDGKLYVRVPYDDNQGKRHHRERRLAETATPEDAINLIAQLRMEIGANPARLGSEQMTFDQLLIEFRRAHPKLKSWYSDPLAFFAGRKLRSLSYADCLHFKQVRQQVKRLVPDPANRKIKIEVERKPATINRELETLRSVLLYAVRHGWMDRNPMNAGPVLIQKSEEDQRERLPTLDEEARLLSVCVPPREHLRGLILATRDTGLRRSALLALDWSMVDWINRLLNVPRGNRFKRRPRLIGLTDRLWEELRAMWMARSQPATGQIFTGAADFKRSYRTACRLAGVSGLRFNDLRHGFATDLMEAGVEERLAMKVAGHNNAKTHAIYTNVDERLALQVAAALNRLHQNRRVSVCE